MPLYLGQFSYSSDAIKALVDKPEDRLQAAREGVESLGAKLIGIWRPAPVLPASAGLR